MKIVTLLLLLYSSILATDSSKMKIMFAGDIMGHRSQIASAYSYKSRSYSYDNVFKRVSKIFERADFAIANLELTFGGKPYGGFPRFSSPDTLAEAIKRANINVLVTANNHTADRGCRGIKRTILTLDNNKILHTGSFASQEERESKNLLILQKGDLRVGLLNYTQDTNGIYVSKPCIVNLIKKEQIETDIKMAKEEVDTLIVFLHWGEQYRHRPTKSQKRLAKFLIRSGVDMVIGSHPHVIEPIYYQEESNTTKASIIAYSLGNFISNQQRTGRDGGVILEVDITKDADKTTISDARYYLTWVHRYYSKARGKRVYEIIPLLSNEKREFHYSKMRQFERSSKRVLRDSNIRLTQSITNDTAKTIALNYFKREILDELIVP